MLQETLISIFKRDLQLLILELSTYKNVNIIWKTEESISNSAGNLTLHIIGNLNHFIGFTIGKTGYIRKRGLEFTSKNILREKMIQEIEETIVMIEKTISEITTKALTENYPIEVFKKQMTTQYFLVHLTTHLSYHLGQINYHRRLLER